MLERLLQVRGCIPHEAVHHHLATERKSIDQLMLDLLPYACEYSRAPISNYHVGAVVRGVSGALYLGANLEIPGATLAQTVHAEQSAIANAFMNGDEVMMLAISAVPCGHCRQFLTGLTRGRRVQILIPDKGALELADLLPHAFHLNAAPDLWSFESSESDELAHAAIEAAQKSDAYYSKSPSGVAIRSKSGEVYEGAYIENSAFNPSLPPLQVALCAMAVANEPFQDIDEAVLVEYKGGPVSHASSTAAALRCLAPKANLRIVAL